MRGVVVSASELDFRPLPGRTAANPFAGDDTGGLSMRVVHIDAGATRSPHRHPHSHEAIYAKFARLTRQEERHGLLTGVHAG